MAKPTICNRLDKSRTFTAPRARHQPFSCIRDRQHIVSVNNFRGNCMSLGEPCNSVAGLAQMNVQLENRLFSTTKITGNFMMLARFIDSCTTPSSQAPSPKNATPT